MALTSVCSAGSTATLKATPISLQPEGGAELTVHSGGTSYRFHLARKTLSWCLAFVSDAAHVRHVKTHT